MAAKNFNHEPPQEVRRNLQMFVGETIIAKADVKRYNSMSSQEYGVAGELVVTNFKIAFVYSSESEHKLKKHDSVVSLDKILSQEHCHLNDLIPLTSIYKIHAISNLKQKRKKVKNAKKELSEHYNIIEIETKDFRVILYDFTNSEASDRRACFKMISHYAYPTSITRLFGFDYGGNIDKTNSEKGRAFCMFSHVKDYEMNLSRLQSSGQWRVSSVNHKFKICNSLPEFNVCPATLGDEELQTVADFYVDKRFPIWVWNDSKSGAALLISSKLRESPDHPKELLESITSCHQVTSTGSGTTEAIDVCSSCPTLKELKSSFDQLRKASVVHSNKEFWGTESTWLSDIEDSRWLYYVSKCLAVSEKIARILKEDNHSVIVNDENGRDFSILTTSLVQILLDPYYRTLVGLQALIQKDWVMGGHPFSRRLRNIYEPWRKLDDDYDGECPVFVLFLDCVHQLVHQFPLNFEYTEQFLMLIVNCSHSSLFKTFMFDCDSDFQTLRGDTNLVSVWDFIAVNMPLSKYSFRNPAFDLEKIEPSSSSSSSQHPSIISFFSNPSNEDVNEFLEPSTKQMDIHLWTNYFCRWFPSTSISKGFTTNVILQLQQKRLMEEVSYLEARMLQLQRMSGLIDDRTFKSNSSSLNRRIKQHKGENNSEEEDYESFFSLMSDFYFLKIL